MAETVTQILKHLILFLIEIVKNVLSSLIPDSFRKKKCIENEIVLITGAASGTGRSLANKFAEQGCKVVLVDVNLSALVETKQHLEEKYGANIVWSYQVDVSDRNAIYRLAEKVTQEVGQVDILVNNAAIIDIGYFLDLEDEVCTKLINVNLMAYFWTTKAFLPGMVERGQGHLVYVSSAAAFCGVPVTSTYCAAKAGTAFFSEAIGQEMLYLGWNGIKVSTVFLSAVRSNLYADYLPDKDNIDHGLIPLMEPDYVANEIVQGVLIGREKIYVPHSLFCFILMKPFMNAKAMWHLTAGTVFGDDPSLKLKLPKKELRNASKK